MSEEKVLIDTTEALLTVSEELGIPMNIFCDVACLWRYRKLGQQDFPNAVEKQLRQAIVRGHDVQAHIHPHWLKTDIIKTDKNCTRYEFACCEQASLRRPFGHRPVRKDPTDCAGPLFRRPRAYLLPAASCPARRSRPRCGAARTRLARGRRNSETKRRRPPSLLPGQSGLPHLRRTQEPRAQDRRRSGRAPPGSGSSSTRQTSRTSKHGFAANTRNSCDAPV